MTKPRKMLLNHTNFALCYLYSICIQLTNNTAGIFRFKISTTIWALRTKNSDGIIFHQ